jgi:hypothetical protein
MNVALKSTFARTIGASVSALASIVGLATDLPPSRSTNATTGVRWRVLRPPPRRFGFCGAADASGAAILGVIDSKDEEVLQLVPTYNVAAVAGTSGNPASTAHSVAADSKNNRIFVPLGANNVFPFCTTGCIAVYWHGDEDNSGEAATPP